MQYKDRESCQKAISNLQGLLTGGVLLRANNGHEIYDIDGSLIGINQVNWDYREKGKILQVSLATTKDPEILKRLRSRFGISSFNERIFDDEIAIKFL